MSACSFSALLSGLAATFSVLLSFAGLFSFVSLGLGFALPCVPCFCRSSALRFFWLSIDMAGVANRWRFDVGDLEMKRSNSKSGEGCVILCSWSANRNDCDGEKLEDGFSLARLTLRREELVRAISQSNNSSNNTM